MGHVQPDLTWYSAISSARDLPSRCPFANVHRCPRYYQSLAILGERGIATRIPATTDQALLARWRATDVWPVVDEHATSIVSFNDQPSQFSNFCPEVAHDVFHLFANTLLRYVDDTDREIAYKRLHEDRVGPDDWRWLWSHVAPMHFTECPLYSQLPTSTTAHEHSRAQNEIITAKPGMFGFSVDLKKLMSRFAKWWLSRYG